MYVCMCISVVSIYSIHIPQTEQTSLGPLWEGLNYIHPESFESSSNKHDCWGPGGNGTHVHIIPSWRWNPICETQRPWKWTLHPKAPKTIGRSSTSPSWWLLSKMKNEWINDESLSLWSIMNESYIMRIIIMMIMDFHDTSEAWSSRLNMHIFDESRAYATPNAGLTQPEKRVDHTWSCCQQVYQLWWLIFFLRFYNIFHHGICYQYVTHWSSTPFKKYIFAFPVLQILDSILKQGWLGNFGWSSTLWHGPLIPNNYTKVSYTIVPTVLFLSTAPILIELEANM